MRRLSKLKSWTVRKWRTNLQPVLSDAWYAVRTGSLTERCLGTRARNDRNEAMAKAKEDLKDARSNQVVGSHAKPLSTYTQEEVVRLIRKEITLGDAKEYRICRLCQEREVDGASLISATNEELMELGFDGVLARKLRMKIEDHGRDRTAEYKIEELRYHPNGPQGLSAMSGTDSMNGGTSIFLYRCGLPQYRDRLINDLGVFDVDELPTLIGNKQWVRSLRMRVDEELPFKLAVRQFAADRVAAERAKLKSLGIVDKNKRSRVKLTHDISASHNMHAREDLNRAIRDQGLSELRIKRTGNPAWFQDMPPTTPMRERGLGYMAQLRHAEGLNSGAITVSAMDPGEMVAAVSGRKPSSGPRTKLPPGHRIDETIARLAPRRNRV